MLVKDAMEQKVPCALYTLSLRVTPETKRAAQKMGVPIKEYAVFHELLTDLLHSAGLPGPAKELANMRDDGARSSPGRAKK